MTQEFKDKNEWALILGGSSGLGLASAVKLAKHGLNIFIVYRARKADLAELNAAIPVIKESGVQCLSVNIDATRIDRRKDMVSAIAEKMKDGKLKVLVHSIARGNLKPMLDNDATLQNQDFHLTLDAMAISLYDWVRSLYERKLFAADARVISFTSEGNTKAWPNYAAVSVAKVALEAITRSIALEFAPHGIRANCIQAGAVDTPSFRMIPGSEELKKHSLKRNPYGRLTIPEDVANVVYLLSKEEASWINGCIIPVNGGEHLQ